MQFGLSRGSKSRNQKEKKEGPVRYRNKEFDNKIFKVRLAKVLKVVIPAVIVFTVICVCAHQWNTRVFSTYEVVKTVEENYVTGTTVMEFDGNLLTFSKDGVSCVNQSGKNVWNQTYEMQNPMIAMNGDKVAIGDYNGRTIYVCSTEKILGSISTNLPIRSFTVSGDGIVAAVLEDAELSWIKVFTVDGANPVTAKTQMKNSGYPLQIAFSPNSEILAVSYLYVQDSRTTTRMAFYNFGDVGQNYQDQLVSAYEYQNLVVPSVFFLNNSACAAIGSKRIMFYEGAQIPSSQAETIQNREIQMVFQDAEYVGLVYRNEDTEYQYCMDVYDQNGKLVQTIPYSFECKHFLINDDWIILYNEEECKIVTLKGKVKLEASFQEAIHLLLPTDYKYRYVLFTNEGLQTIELK